VVPLTDLRTDVRKRAAAAWIDLPLWPDPFVVDLGVAPEIVGEFGLDAARVARITASPSGPVGDGELQGAWCWLADVFGRFAAPREEARPWSAGPWLQAWGTARDHLLRRDRWYAALAAIRKAWKTAPVRATTPPAGRILVGRLLCPFAPVLSDWILDHERVGPAAGPLGGLATVPVTSLAPAAVAASAMGPVTDSSVEPTDEQMAVPLVGQEPVQVAGHVAEQIAGPAGTPVAGVGEVVDLLWCPTTRLVEAFLPWKAFCLEVGNGGRRWEIFDVTRLELIVDQVAALPWVRRSLRNHPWTLEPCEEGWAICLHPDRRNAASSSR